MKIFKFFFFAISGFIGLYIIACVFMPSNFEVSREIEINANPLIVLIKLMIFIIGTIGIHGLKLILPLLTNLIILQKEKVLTENGLQKN